MQIMRTIAIALLCLQVVLAGCAGGRSSFSKAQKLEAEGRLDEAVLKYAEAAADNPAEGEFRLRFLDVSSRAAQIHMQKGEEFLEKENLEEAYREFQAAVALDSSLDRARQASEKVMKLKNSLVYQKEAEELEKNRKPREAIQAYKKALEFDPENKKAVDAVARLQKSRRSKLDGTELNLKSSKPITLKFKDAKIKDVFNIITQLSGINFVFDEGIKDSNVNIYLENATFQQALDVITGIHKLGTKILNENTIILYTNSPDKKKQYEELMLQTFYLNKLDAKKAVNLIRTMLQVKKIYVNEEMNALVIRDVPEVIEVAGRILEANDVPDAEVLLEVEVIEVSKKNAESFGLALSKYAISMNAFTPGGSFLSDALSSTVTTPAAGTGTTTATAAQPTSLLNVFNWRNFQGYMTVPNATFNFGKTLSNAETLASPKIRVKNREKAKFNVGTRVPITTTSSPTGGGVSVNVQYVDVGVKLNAEPTIQLNNEVNMKLSLEVSSIILKEKIGDSTSLTTVVTIGTRNLDTVLSLKDGETSVIGGLMQDNKTKSKQKFMVLGDIPIIGPLFSSHDDSDDKTELILAITPRIVRGVVVPEGDVAQFWSGREDEPSVNKPYSSFVQEADFINPELQTGVKVEPAAQPVQPEPAPSPAQLPVASQPTPVTTPVPSPAKQEPSANLPVTTTQPSASVPVPTVTAAPAQPLQQPVVAAAAIPAPAATPAPAPAPKAVRVSVTIAAPPMVKVKDQFIVEIKSSDVSGLQKAPFVLAYDPIFVEYVGAAEGDLLKKDGKPVAFKASNDRNTGQVSFTISRPDDAPGVSGSGRLATVTFRAKNQGPASFGLMGVNFTAKGGYQIDTLPYNTVVEVK